MNKYDITDYLKDDKELQKAVIQELLDDLKCAVMNVENLLETKQRLKSELAELKAENERLKKEIKNNKSAYQVELGTYNMECGNLLEENKQLWQTLQEIKEIAEQSNVDCIYRISVIRKILTKAEEE